MAYEIVSTPERLIEGTTVKSRWVATDCPVIFGVQRNDGVILQVNQVGAVAQIVVNLASPNFALTLGEEILLFTVQNGSGTLQSNYTRARVTAVNSPGYYTTDAPWTEAVYDSNRVLAYTRPINYLLDCRLTINDKAIYFTATPSPKGFAEVQVNRYLWEQVNDVKLGTYASEAVAEANQCGRFDLAIRESYIGSLGNYQPVSGTYSFVKASREKDEGANLSEFVPNYIIPSKFLNLFGEPTLVRGLPFDVSFIYPTELGDKVNVVETQLSASGASVGTKTTLLDAMLHKGKMVSYWVDTSALPTSCVAVRVELQGDDTPIVVVDTWYISTAPFSSAKPLKLKKDLTSKVVTVTGQFQYGGKVALPSNALWPAAGAATIPISTQAVAPRGDGGTVGKMTWLEFSFKTPDKLIGVTDGFARCLFMTGSGQFANEVENFTAAQAIADDGLRGIFFRLFSKVVATCNAAAGRTAFACSLVTGTGTGQVGKPCLLVESLPGVILEASPIAYTLLSNLIVYPFLGIAARTLTYAPDWTLPLSPTQTLTVGDIGSTGYLSMYRLDSLGVDLNNYAINTTYTAVP